MAYVAISGPLIDSVRTVVHQKRSAEITTFPAPNRASYVAQSTEREVFLEKFWGSYRGLLDQMPESWMRRMDNINGRCSYEVPNPDKPDETISGSVSREVQFRPPLMLPPNAETYGVYFEVTQDNPIVAEYVAYDAQVKAAHQRWRKVEADVVSFLRSCKSLNEALKLWPDVRIYIPQGYLDRAEEKTAKSKAAESRALEVLKSIDTDAAVASAVMVRILEANKQQEAQQ